MAVLLLLAIYFTQVTPTCCGPGLRQTRGAIGVQWTSFRAGDLMITRISRSVGIGGANLSTDVRTIQALLDAIPALFGGPQPLLSIDGLAGPRTNGSITLVGYLLHSGNPNLLRSGLAADTRGHRRAVVFGDQATALHQKTA